MVSIAFTGGGSGGHIYPGLAIASWAAELFPCRVFWIGSSAKMDRDIVEKTGLEFFSIPSGKLRRYFSPRNFLDFFRVCAGYFAARKILRLERPGLLFSKGGFVSVPPCAAAKSLRIPVFTHESDFSPGLATRMNTRFAEKVFIPYRESVKFYTGQTAKKTVVSGNPIRREFADASAAKGLAFLGLGEDERILLVLGGSLGSQEINSLVRNCLPCLTRYYTVVHQTGENDSASIYAGDSPGEKSLCHDQKGRYISFAYIKDELPHIIAAAELVLCRSGAGTIWECKYLRKPMVLIPLRGSGTRGDQVENARLFCDAGAAVCFIPPRPDDPACMEEDANELCALISSLAEDPKKRRDMEESVMEGKDAAAFIANEIITRVTQQD